MSLVKRMAATLPHPVYRVIRRHRVAALVRRFEPRDVVHTYGGLRFTVHLADPLAQGWYDRDWPVPNEVEVLARLGVLGAGALVFDLGAHQGVVAMMLAAQVGETGRVIAVEAEPHNAAVAERNVGANRAENVSVLHAAVADVSGTISFAEGLNGHVDASTRHGNVTVTAVTVDELAGRFGRPDVVFLDVEGYEGKALDGAAATLASRATSFLIEVHVEELVDCTAAELIERFAEAYDTYVAREEDAGFTRFDGDVPATRFFLAAVPRVPGPSANLPG